MRAAFALLVVVAGCRSSGASVEEQPVAPIVRLDLPQLDESAHVLVLTDPKPAAVVWVGTDGTMAIKPGATWNGDIKAPPRAPPPDDLKKSVLEAIVEGGGPRADKAKTELQENRAWIERQRVLRRLRRPSGPDVPADGRLQAADVVALDQLSRLAPLVVATPSAPATAVARLLQRIGGVVAVDHLGKLAVLAIAFEPERDRPTPGTGSWLELVVDTKGVHLITQPANKDRVIPWAGAEIDRAALTTAYVEAGKLPLDVTVRADTTMQTLVEVLAALRAIDVRAIAVAPGPATADERAEQIKTGRVGDPGVMLGLPNAQGDLDKSAIAAVVRDHLPKLKECYTRELFRDPMLRGTVQTQFFITPNGTVATATSSGVHATVSSCVANVFRAMVFPNPKGGGGVQVNYPLMFQ